MDVVTIERDFTSWVAEKLNLSPDNGIYRGGIPENLTQGIAVMLGAEIPSQGFYGFRPRTWNAQILAKFEDRDAAMMLQSTLNGLFPCPGFTCGNTKFLTVEPRGTSEPYAAEDDGRVKTFVTLNVVLSVLTAGTQTHNFNQA